MASLNTSIAALPVFLNLFQRTVNDTLGNGFLPSIINTFMNLVNSTLPNLGSGSTSRLGTSLRLGILISFNLFSRVYSHEYPIEYSLTR